MHSLKSILVLMVVAATFATRAQDIHSVKLTDVTIDGKPDEWPQPFRYYEGTTKLQFAFSNDSANLYICLKITDMPTQLRLFNSGLNIWIDSKGKKKETCGLFFPTPQERDPGTSSGQKRHQQGEDEGLNASMQKTDQFRMRHHAKSTQLTLHVKGFMGVPEQVLPLINNLGINAAFEWDTFDILTIEYKVPLALVFGHPLTTADTTKSIGIGFIEPAPSPEHKGVSNGAIPEGERGAGDVTSSNYGMNHGALGNGAYNNGMRGNNMNSGMGGGSHMAPMDNNPANQEQKVWSKVFLRYK